MDKYVGQNCSCQRDRSMQSRCDCDPPMRNRNQWQHRHDGVDSMQIAMAVCAVAALGPGILSGRRIELRNHFSGIK